MYLPASELKAQCLVRASVWLKFVGRSSLCGYAGFPFFLLALFISQPVAAQVSADSVSLYQLTGTVLNQATGQAVPYVHLAIGDSRKGTVSNVNGYFSLVVEGGDTLLISSVGYKEKRFPIPTNLEGYLQSATIMLRPDTILLDQTTVYPWPSKAAFRDAFMALETEEENEISPYAGFNRVDNPTEPEPTVMNPISLFYEKVIKKVKQKRHSKKMSKELPKWD